MSGSSNFRDAAPALCVFALALAWLLLLRPYGFQLEDEGTLLFWFDRVTRGQQPYVDFHTGYTPGFFAFGTAVFGLFGPSATAVRAVLAVINALAAAGLTEATRRVAGNWLAPIPALLWLAFVPVYVGEFAAFNIPYPTWPVTLAWVVLALAMLSWIERPRGALLVVAGVMAALAMWLRPNSGAFALAAATWIVAGASVHRSLVDRASALAASAFMALGVWYTFQFRIAGEDAFVHLLPVLAITLFVAFVLPGRLGHAGRPRAFPSLAIVAAAFALPTLAWTVPLVSKLGSEAFLREVFLVGADYQTIYYKPHPAPEPYAMLVVAGILAVAGAGRLVARGVLRPFPVLAAGAALGAGVWMSAFRPGIAPEGVVHSITGQLENASFWLAASASFGAVAWLARAPSAEIRCSPRARAMVVLTPLAVAMYLQMFPRSDFMHQVTAVPLLAVVACGLLDRVASWWARGCWPPGWSGALVVRRAVQALAAAVVLLALGEKAAGPLQALTHPAPATSISPYLDVRVEAAAGDELEAIAGAVAFLRANSDDGEALWSFPATSGLLFAAGRSNAAPHDYWYPGRPDRAEEQRVLGMLQEERPRYIVTLGYGWNFLDESPLYFEGLREFAVTNYRLAGRFGRYDILGRRDIAGEDCSVATCFAQPAPGNRHPRLALIDANLERRRQAARRWMDDMTLYEVDHAALPSDPREALLLLRALRDGGDMRGAVWAMLGYDSGDARIRGEAVDAMVALAKDYRSQRARFANDFDAASYRPFLAPSRDRAQQLMEIPLLRPFAAAALELAGAPAEPAAATPP